MTWPVPRALSSIQAPRSALSRCYAFLVTCAVDLFRLVGEEAARPAKPSARLNPVRGSRTSYGDPNRCGPGDRRPNTGIAQHPLAGAGRGLQDDQETAMTFKAEIRRRCRSREEACAYLSSRGFLCLPSGWANGRWAATLDRDRDGCVVTVWLRIEAEAREIRVINRNWDAGAEGAPAA